MQKLLDNGSAYKCFCTERRLNILRRDAIRHQKIPKYDNKCRSLSDIDIKDKMRNGTPYCIRFKVKKQKKYLHKILVHYGILA